MPCPEHSRQRGVTLIEMVIVIAITAIIAGAVSVFISRPVEGYADAARRAEMSDIADTALRRITRDLRTALANSIRITEFPAASGIWYLEYLQGSGGGRYRAEKDSSGAGLPLDFTAPAASFDVIGNKWWWISATTRSGAFSSLPLKSAAARNSWRASGEMCPWAK